MIGTEPAHGSQTEDGWLIEVLVFDLKWKDPDFPTCSAFGGRDLRQSLAFFRHSWRWIGSGGQTPPVCLMVSHQRVHLKGDGFRPGIQEVPGGSSQARSQESVPAGSRWRILDDEGGFV